jgi:hypothetical protein
MGWAITWCAVREEKAEQFLNQLGLSPTGKTEELPGSLMSIVVLSRTEPVRGLLRRLFGK